MQKPLPSPGDDSPRSDTRVDPSQRADDTVCGVGMPPKFESLRTRFNPRLVGFGIISPSVQAPNVKEVPIRNVQAAGTPSGGNLEDRK